MSAGARGRYFVECGSCQVFFSAFACVMNVDTMRGFVFIAFLMPMGSYGMPHSANWWFSLISVLVFFPCQYINNNLCVCVYAWHQAHTHGLFCHSLLTTQLASLSRSSYLHPGRFLAILGMSGKPPYAICHSHPWSLVLG